MSSVDINLDHSRYRLWFDDDPGAAFVPDGWIEGTVAVGSGHVTCRRLAVEAMVATGGRALYGLAGCKVAPSKGDRSNLVKVAHREASDGAFASSLAVRTESPVLGLPRDFAAAMVRAIADATSENLSRRPIVLEFERAAWGPVGSSPVFFSYLARLVMALMVRPLGDVASARAAIETVTLW
jgi:hypothetical protein